MRRLVAATALAAAMILSPRPCTAFFHLSVINEVMSSYGGDPAAQFIEIKMLSGSQNLVAHSVLAAFDASGTYIGDILEVPANVPLGAMPVT